VAQKNAKSVFLDVINRCSPDQWPQVLDETCGSDLPLRQEVERLLYAHRRNDVDLVRPAEAALLELTVDQPSVSEKPGTQIGPYKLREQIGEGGFGVVYVAQQSKPVSRKVALKIIKPGMDTKEVIARFEAERQALALMEHPNVAKVLDAGATESGRPYFVMELVNGVPITEFCDDRKLPTRERLHLFIDVCRAVQHAHQKGIIHRDLKPSNILVTLDDGRPIPKVIDFGISKALSRQLTENSIYTAYGQIVGTPLYMAPEQAELSMRDVDTRSDVYSLGVLLYELLTGTTPFDKETLQKSGFDEMRRIIREVEPLRPSARISTLQAEMLSTVSDRRKIDARKLSHSLRGELDWIVMKALEKDRNRRYESASAFAADIERFLADEPVQARPASVWYKFSKFYRRKKTAATVALVVVPALLLAVASIGYTIRDQSAREQERERERTTRQTILTEKVDGALKRSRDKYRDGKLSEALTAVEQAKGLLAGETGNAALMEKVLRWRTDLQMAIRLQQIRLDRAAAGPEGWNNSGADDAYKAAFRKYGLDVESLTPDAAAKRINQSAIKDRLIFALDDWAVTRWRAQRPGREKLLAVAMKADPDPWRNEFRRTFAKFGKDYRDRLLKLARDPRAASQPPLTLYQFAIVLGTTGIGPTGKRRAAELLQAALARYPSDFWINNALGAYLADPARSVGYFRAALALRPDSAQAWSNLASTLEKLYRFREAEAAYRTAIRLKPDLQAHFSSAETRIKAVDGAKGAASLTDFYDKQGGRTAQSRLAYILHLQGKWSEAEKEARKAVRLSPIDSQAYHTLSTSLLKQRRPAEAAAVWREFLRTVPLQPTATGYYESWHGQAVLDLGSALMQQGKLAEAETEFRDIVRRHPKFWYALLVLGDVYRARRKLDEAEKAYRQAAGFRPFDSGPRVALAKIYLARGKPAEAEAEYRAAARLGPNQAKLQFDFGQFLVRRRKWGDALAAYETAARLQPYIESGWNRLAYWLLTCPDPKFRNVKRAVEVARKLVEMKPNSAFYWQLLGWAEYRAAKEQPFVNMQPCIDALQKSCKLQPGGQGDSYQGIVLALAYAHQERDLRRRFASPNPAMQKQQKYYQTEARRWYDNAVNDIDCWPRFRGDPLGRCVAEFRLEAAELLGLPLTPAALLLRARLAVEKRDWDRAAADYARVLNQSPGKGVSKLRQRAYRELAAWDEVFSRLAQARPRDVELQFGRSHYFAMRGRWKQAAGAYARIAPASLRGECFVYACTLLLSGDKDAYRRLCRFARDQFGVRRGSAWLAGQICGLDPDSGIDVQQLLAWSRTAVSIRRDKFSLYSLAVADYRAGRFQETVDVLEEALKHHQAHRSNVAFLMALAHYRLGHQRESRKWLAEGLKELRYVPKDANGRVTWAPGHWCNVNVWYREARAAMIPSVPVVAPKPRKQQTTDH
jgi:eukaryotic-like serine/threonine-protein kinase